MYHISLLKSKENNSVGQKRQKSHILRGGQSVCGYCIVKDIAITRVAMERQEWAQWSIEGYIDSDDGFQCGFSNCKKKIC